MRAPLGIVRTLRLHERQGHCLHASCLRGDSVRVGRAVRGTKGAPCVGARPASRPGRRCGRLTQPARCPAARTSMYARLLKRRAALELGAGGKPLAAACRCVLSLQVVGSVIPGIGLHFTMCGGRRNAAFCPALPRRPPHGRLHPNARARRPHPALPGLVARAAARTGRLPRPTRLDRSPHSLGSVPRRRSTAPGHSAAPSALTQ